jgi:hypothetical protein
MCHVEELRSVVEPKTIQARNSQARRSITALTYQNVHVHPIIESVPSARVHTPPALQNGGGRFEVLTTLATGEHECQYQVMSKQ